MAILRLCLFFIIIVLLVCGATGLNEKESIAFTIFGLEVSVIVCTSIGIMVVMAVCLFVFEEPRPRTFRKFAAWSVLIILSSFFSTETLQYDKPFTILGFNFYYLPPLCMYISTYYMGLSAVCIIFYKQIKRKIEQ